MNIKRLAIFIITISIIFVVLFIYLPKKDITSFSESNGLGGGGGSVGAFYDDKN